MLSVSCRPRSGIEGQLGETEPVLRHLWGGEFQNIQSLLLGWLTFCLVDCTSHYMTVAKTRGKILSGSHFPMAHATPNEARSPLAVSQQPLLLGK